MLSITVKNNTIDREREFGKEIAWSRNKTKKYECFQILKLANFTFMLCDVRAVLVIKSESLKPLSGLDVLSKVSVCCSVADLLQANDTVLLKLLT